MTIKELIQSFNGKSKDEIKSILQQEKQNRQKFN